MKNTVDTLEQSSTPDDALCIDKTESESETNN